MDRSTYNQSSEFQNYFNYTSTYSPTAIHIAQVASVILTITGTLENSLVLYVVIRNKTLHNIHTSLVMNLCLADLLWSVYYQPLLAVFYFKGWIFGDLFCCIFPYMMYSHLGASILNMLLITVNRYVFIVHPIHYTQIFHRKSMVIILLVACWTSWGVFLLLPLFQVWGRFGFDGEVYMCSLLRNYQPASYKVYMGIAFGIPCSLMIFCYFHIIAVVRRTRLAVRNKQISDNLGEVTGTCQATRQTYDLRLTKIIALIFLSFLLCYGPYTILNITAQDFDRSITQIVLTIPGWMTATINPVLYVVMNSQFRKAMINQFTKS